MSEIKGTLSSEELVRIVRMEGENGDIDAKGPVSWDGAEQSAALAKDIAAFANSRNGGYIVIGKKEKQSGGFDPVGVTQEQAATFDTTKVAQWVNNRFSPPIRLVCYPQEVDGKLFVVIEVLEFHDVPIMCVKSFQCPKKGNHLLKDKTIYVRSENAASAPLATVDELRTLVGLATRKKRDDMLASLDAMLRGRPLVPPATDVKQFEDELAKVEAVLEAQRPKDGHGEWLFAFHPARYDAARWTERESLESLIQKHRFRVFEEFPPSSTGTPPHERAIANGICGGAWALTRSGLFVARRPFPEDWTAKPISARLYFPVNGTGTLSLAPGKWIEYGPSLRAICESFYFMWRMAEEYGPEETINYQLRAGPLAGRTLVSDGGAGIYDVQNSFGPPGVCQEPTFRRQGSLLVAELRADWNGECVSATKDFFELFPNQNISQQEIREWIDGFLPSRQRA